MLTPAVLEPLRWLLRSPGGQLLAGALVLACAFPSRVSGSLGLIVLAGGLGVGVAMAWPHAPSWLKKPPARIATALVLAMVVIAGLSVFWDVLTESPDWQMGDWGPQRAVLAHMMPSLPGFDVPVWDHALSTGDAPLELYPSLAYFVAGHLALLFGLENDLPLALMVTAVIVHVGLAMVTAAIAATVAPRPIALVVGLLALVDSGAVAHGGTVGLFRWALLHSAMALLFSTIAALGIVAALRRPRVLASLTIWLATALACATHPAGLLAAAASMAALGGVALLASDVKPRRALIALGHVALGVALAACIWMPLAARILAYGQHFPNALRTGSRLLEDLLQSPSPATAYAMLGYAGYLGIVAGLWSRRAVVVYIAATALVLLVGLSDIPYLAFELVPGQGVARLGVERLAALARPFIAAAGAYTLATLLRLAIASWSTATPRRRMIAAALIGIMSCTVLRALPGFWATASARAEAEARVLAPNALDRTKLVAWATTQAEQLEPGAWARAMFEEDTHEHMHVTAITGLPTFHPSWLPDLLLRERIEDTTPESLRRFDVRWVIGLDKSPSLGDPATELVLGSYHIRELATWDGKFARVEQGTGTVTVTRLDDRAVEVDVKATEPVLVALGTGYYPRWRATHASGDDEPVFASLATPKGTLHVVSAWLAPGRTTFTCDGPLPSDHDGRFFSIAAALIILGALFGWRRVRWRILRRVARVRLPVAAIARFGVPLVVVTLLVRGCSGDLRAVRTLQLGHGIRGTATVEARILDGAWTSCDYNRVPGEYRCDNMLSVYDATTDILNDAAPSWGFNSPSITGSIDHDDVEVRITLHERLSGVYLAAVGDGTADLEVEGDESRTINRATLAYTDAGERTIVITAKPLTATWAFTFVREDQLVPPRPFLDPPPVEAPPEVRAIHIH